MDKSIIILCFKEKSYQMYKKMWEELQKEIIYPKKPCEVLKSYEFSTDNSAIYILRFEDINWCDYYRDVEKLKEFMDLLDSEQYKDNSDYAYKMIRIGENIEDIEVRKNDIAEDILSDFYPYIDINLPNIYKKIDF